MITISLPGIASTTANLLANSDLQSAPADGLLRVRMQSTQADGVYSISAGNEIIVKSQPVPFRATIQIDDMWPSQDILVTAGQQLVVAYTEVTAATAAMIADFYFEGEF